MHRSLKLVPVGIVIVYFLIIIALCATNTLVFSGILFSYGTTLVSAWVMVGFGSLLFAMARTQYAGDPQSAWSLARGFILSRWRYDRFFSVLMPFLCVVPCRIASYTLFKTTYLASEGFLVRPDPGPGQARPARRRCLAADPWTAGQPWISQLLDLLYHGWFLRR